MGLYTFFFRIGIFSGYQHSVKCLSVYLVSGTHSIFLMSRKCIFEIKGMLNSSAVQVLVWLFSPYYRTALYNLPQHQRPPPSFFPFPRHFCSCSLLLVLILFWFHSKLMLTLNKVLQRLDFCQASWLIKAVKLISLLIQTQEPTILATLFLFVLLGSSEEFKNQYNHA